MWYKLKEAVNTARHNFYRIEYERKNGDTVTAVIGVYHQFIGDIEDSETEVLNVWINDKEVEITDELESEILEVFDDMKNII